jgi:hypothetical protein
MVRKKVTSSRETRESDDRVLAEMLETAADLNRHEKKGVEAILG